MDTDWNGDTNAEAREGGHRKMEAKTRAMQP
jgi:hypothetical protein